MATATSVEIQRARDAAHAAKTLDDINARLARVESAQLQILEKLESLDTPRPAAGPRKDR